MKKMNLEEFEQYLCIEYDRLKAHRNMYDHLDVDPDPEVACAIEDFINEIEIVQKWVAFYYIDNIL